MDTAHRDRLAFIRICSGVFERGMVVTHARTGRPFATKYAQHVFGRERESIDVAYPGDVVGLVNAAALGVGDTLYADAAGDLPAADDLRARALRRLPRPGHRASTSSSAAASSSWTPRASSRCCARTAAATRRRCWRSSARCSSRSPPTAWSTSSAPRSTWTGCPTAWRCAPTRPRRPSSRPPAAPRCCSAPTASYVAVFTDKWGLRVFQQDKHPDLHARAAGRRPALADLRRPPQQLRRPPAPPYPSPRRSPPGRRAGRCGRTATTLVRFEPGRQQLGHERTRGVGRHGHRQARRPHRGLGQEHGAGQVRVGRAAPGGARRRGGAPGERLGGPHQRQRQPLGLDVDQRDVAQRGEDQDLRLEPQRHLPLPRRERRPAGRPGPRRRRRPAPPTPPGGCAGPGRRPAGRSRATNGCSSSSSNRSA